MSDTEKVPPHSEEAEVGALGAMILDAVRLVPVARTKMMLPVEAWFIPKHKLIATAIYELANEGLDRVDLLTVTEKLSALGRLDMVGGSIGVETIVDRTPTSAHGEYYLDIVRQKWLLRGVISACHDTLSDAYQAERGDELLKSAPNRFVNLASGIEEEVSNLQLMEASERQWRDAHEKKTPAIGIDTPWDVITSLMCGFEEGVTVLAGRPSAGKTTVEDMIAVHVAQKGIPVGRISLDQTRRALLQRAMCREAGVSLPKLKFGFAGESGLGKVADAKEHLNKLPLYIAENVTQIAQIATTARMWKAKYGIGMLTLDYLQQVQANELGREQHHDVTRVTYVSGALKRLSHELSIPLLLLCQLNREVEKENRAPKLSDLRDSGAIEQDAEKVVFVFRDMKKVKEMEERSPGATKHKRPIWISLMKHKDGETGDIPFWMYPAYFRMAPAEPDFTDDDLPTSREPEKKLMGNSKKPEWFEPEEFAPQAEDEN